MENSNRINNLARNTSYLTIALIIQKVFSFFYFVLLARSIGPESLGKYYFAISLTTIFAIFIDLGLVNYLIRETAKGLDSSSKLLSNILGLKLISSLVSLGAVFLFINFLGHYDTLSKHLVYISSLSMILDSFTLSFFGAIRGFHNLKYESIASVIFQLIVLVLGWIFLSLGLDLRIIILSLVIASVFNFVYSYLVLRFKIGFNFKISFDFTVMRKIVVLSLPFALYGIFQRLYTYLDSVFLSFFSGDYYVGIYQIAFKIIFALQFLPMAFTASLYPAMSYYWQNNREQLKIAFKRSMDYLALIAIPISVAVFLLADQILLIFKSDFAGADIPLRFSILALIFIFLNFPVGSLLNAANRQARNTRNMFITLLVAIILNLLFIPRWQALGASLVVLISNALMLILGLIELRKIVSYSWRDNFKVFIRIIFSALLMGLFLSIFKEQVNLFLLIIIAGLVYFFILFLVGGIKKADLDYILKSFLKSKNNL